MSNAFYFLGNLTGTQPTEGAMSLVGSSWSSQSYSQSTTGSPILSLSLYAYSLCDFGASLSLSAYSLTFACTQSSDPGPSGVPKTCVAVVQYSNDTTDGANGTWTTLGTHSLTVSAGGGGGGPTNFAPSFPAVSARMLRIAITDVANTVLTSLTAAIQQTVFSVTASPCQHPDVPIIAAVGVIVGLDSNQMFGGTPEIIITGT